MIRLAENFSETISLKDKGSEFPELIYTADKNLTISSRVLHAANAPNKLFKEFLKSINEDPVLLLSEDKERVASTKASRIRSCMIKDCCIKQIEKTTFSIATSRASIIIEERKNGILLACKNKEVFEKVVGGIKELGAREMWFLPNLEEERQGEKLKQYSMEKMLAIFDSMDLISNPPSYPHNWDGEPSSILRKHPIAELASSQ